MNLVLRHWLAEVVALQVRATFRLDQLQLFEGLDALGRRGHSKALSQGGYGADDRAAVLAFADFGHEGTVDLDAVERKGPEIAQGRKARAKIIHRDAHAQRPELMKKR